MRILLTGGAGFIGSHLANYLADQGHQVGILDRTRDLRAFEKNYHHHEGHPERFYCFDCRELPFILKASDWDYCYHLASTVGVPNVLSDPRECIENIIESTRAVLRLGIPGMYFSTSEVYGKKTGYLSEDSDCVISPKSRWSYAGAKLCSEWLALAENWKVVRLFNVIGPGQNKAYGAVVPKFVELIKASHPVPVHGDGSQKRTFTSVFDVVKILDKLRDKPFQVVNVGSQNTVSIKDLAYSIRRICKSFSPICFVPYGKVFANGFEECPERVPDLTRLRSLIGEFKFQELDNILEGLVQGENTWEHSLQMTR